ncbi:unnamed protein product [Amoebophrya sp. A120]|nr:unnamed protein product [Amoebophrya sp. A120]|eukprot:GSA120T00020548001.1
MQTVGGHEVLVDDVSSAVFPVLLSLLRRGGVDALTFLIPVYAPGCCADPR